MTIDHADFHLSGYTREPLGKGFEALKTLDATCHLWRLVVWDDHGRPNTTIYDDGSSVSDSDGALDLDLTKIESASFEYNVFSDTPVARVTIARRAQGLGIDGFLPLAGSLERLRAEPPITVLSSYADFTLTAAALLRSEVLVVANEYCEETVGGTGISRPSMLVVFREHVVRKHVRDLRRADAVLEKSPTGWVRVWLQAPESFVEGTKPKPNVVKLVESIICELQ